jgi:protein-S-isoprenylcysteine O-methyltransferase Ste14
MNLKLIIIIAFTYLYGFFELIMGFRQKRNKTIVKSGDKMSVWILIFSISLGYFLSFGIGATKIGRIYNWNTFFVIGAILAIFGLIIRIKSISILKKQFTYTVTEIENHEVIETGLYKIIRHPGYLGQLIIFAGISTMLSNWLSIIFMMIPVLIGYIYRITIEERFLITQMGQKYINYQKKTKRLVPLIY